MAMLEIRGVRKSFHTYAKPGVRPGIFGRAPKPVSSLDVLRGVDLTCLLYTSPSPRDTR